MKFRTQLLPLEYLSKCLRFVKKITNLRIAVLDTLEEQNLQCMVNQALEGILKTDIPKSCENTFQRIEVKRKEMQKKYHSKSFTEEIQNCGMKLG